MLLYSTDKVFQIAFLKTKLGHYKLVKMRVTSAFFEAGFALFLALETPPQKGQDYFLLLKKPRVNIPEVPQKQSK